MVIVTGASKGIGKAIAEKFAREGLDLAICSRSKSLMDSLSEELSATYGIKVWGFEADLAQKEQVLRFADNILAINKSIEALVNNAGLFLPGTLATEPNNTLEALLDLNLKSVYYLTKSLLPRFVEQKSGLIANIASTASFMPFWNCISYTISKHALLGFSKCLRQELMPHGVKVTTIMPGPTDSASWDGSGVAQERLMKPQDVADLVWAAYNLSPHAVLEEVVMRPQLGDI